MTHVEVINKQFTIKVNEHTIDIDVQFTMVEDCGELKVID